MVKTTSEVDSLVRRFVERLKRQIVVDRVFVVGRYAFDKAHDDSDLRLVVISPTFEGMNLTRRIDILALTGLKIDPLIQSWGFTPGNWPRVVFPC
jgi:predicted nucleotidyltransferase